MTTTIIAVVIGIIIVIIIHPGKGTKENMYREGKIVQVTAADALPGLDQVRPCKPILFEYILTTSPLRGVDQTLRRGIQLKPVLLGFEMKITCNRKWKLRIRFPIRAQRQKEQGKTKISGAPKLLRNWPN